MHTNNHSTNSLVQLTSSSHGPRHNNTLPDQGCDKDVTSPEVCLFGTFFSSMYSFLVSFHPAPFPSIPRCNSISKPQHFIFIISPLLSKTTTLRSVCFSCINFHFQRAQNFPRYSVCYVSDSSEISAQNQYQPMTTSPFRSILPLSRHWVHSRQRQASGSNPRPQTWVNNYKYNSRRDEFIPMNLPISALLSGSMDTFWSHYTGKFHEQFT